MRSGSKRIAAVRGLVAIAFALAALGEARAQVWLFDATKAEMAGNADWVVDADLHNLLLNSTNGSGSTSGGGTESNPQRVPTVGGSASTAPTNVESWTGGLSAWGTSLVDVKSSTTGTALVPSWQATTSGANSYYPVESLPYNGAITYGNASNAQDLSHYKVFVLCEPNILFTTAEKTALDKFVYNGGSLFIIADHGGSDRNSDGSDATDVWNDLFTTAAPTGVNAKWGISFNGNDVSGASTVIDTSATDPIYKGGFSSSSDATGGFSYDDGSTLTINPTDNSSVKAAVWKTSKSNSTVMIAYGTYGAGRFVAVGDSSPFDDGTGDPKDTLYDGWDTGADADFILNASAWLQNNSTPEPASGVMVVLGVLIFCCRPHPPAPSPFRRGGV